MEQDNKACTRLIFPSLSIGTEPMVRVMGPLVGNSEPLIVVSLTLENVVTIVDIVNFVDIVTVVTIVTIVTNHVMGPLVGNSGVTVGH